MHKPRSVFEPEFLVVIRMSHKTASLRIQVHRIPVASSQTSRFPRNSAGPALDLALSTLECFLALLLEDLGDPGADDWISKFLQGLPHPEDEAFAGGGERVLH